MLTEIFDTMMLYSRRYRKRYEDDDFNKPWEAVEEFLNMYNCEFTNWHPDVREHGPLYEILSKKALDLPEKIITGNEETELLETNHFMIQVFRIPLRFPANFKNLVFIAHNLGLLTAQLRVRDFPDGMVKNIKDQGGLQIINFIGHGDAVRIEVNLTTQIVDHFKSLLKQFYKNQNSDHVYEALRATTTEEMLQDLDNDSGISTDS